MIKCCAHISVNISDVIVVYLWAGWWVRRVCAPGPPGSVCTEGSNLCRPPVCSWTRSCHPLASGAASQGCERQLDLTTTRRKERNRERNRERVVEQIMGSTSGVQVCTCQHGSFTSSTILPCCYLFLYKQRHNNFHLFHLPDYIKCVSMMDLQ